MNYRITIALAAVLAVLLVATWYVGQNGSPPPATGADRGPTLIAAGADDITEIDVRAGGQQVTVRRPDGGDWTYSTSGSAAFQPADTQRIRSLATRLGGLKAQSTIAEQPDDAALKEYGLDAPTMTVTVKTRTGNRAFSVGADNARRTGKYVRATDGGPVYLVESFLLDDLRSLTTSPPVPPTPTPSPTPTATATPAATATPSATAVS